MSALPVGGRRPLLRAARLVVLAAGVGLAAGCSSSAQIETFKYQIADLERQVTMLQRETARQERLDEIRDLLTGELAELAAAQREVSAELARLDERIASLRSELAENGVEVDELRTELAAAQQELVELEEALATAQSGPSRDEVVSTDPRELYQRSYDQFLRGSYEEAIAGFRQYLNRYPNSELADNATYWIGESHFAQGLYQEAIQAFRQVGDLYPNSERIASSLLREGAARLELGDRERGREALLAVVQRYPQSDEAVLARQQLDRLPG